MTAETAQWNGAPFNAYPFNGGYAFVAATAETAAASDSSAVGVVTSAVVAETVSVAETVFGVGGGLTGVAETVAVAETIAGAATRGASAAETNAVSDALSAVAFTAAARNETVAVAESISASATSALLGGVAEAIAVADNVAAAALVASGVAETVAVVASQSVSAAVSSAGVAESVVIVDTGNAVPVMGAARAEIAVIVDTRIVGIDYAATTPVWTQQWNGSPWNAYTFNGQLAFVFSASVAESVGIVDTNAVGILGSRAETAAVVEQIAAVVVHVAAQAELFTANEVIDAASGFGNLRSEWVIVADVVAVTAVYAGFVYDGVAAKDDCFGSIVFAGGVAETVQVVDASVVTSNEVSVAIAEAVGTTDLIRVALGLPTVPAVGFDPIRATVVTPGLVALIDDGFIYATIIPFNVGSSVESKPVYASANNGLIYATVISYGTLAEVDNGALKMAA